MHAVQPSFWVDALPKIHTVGLSIPPAQIHTAGGHPSLSLNPTDPQRPKTTKWATDPKGAHMGVHYAPSLWAQWQVTHEGPNFGGAILEPPFWAHLGSLAHFSVLGP